MSHLLLDSNVLIALARQEGSLLPQAMRNVLESQDTALHVSVASLWEIAIKFRLGKLDLLLELEDLPSFCMTIPATSLAIETHHVLAEPDPVPATRDPFDRLLLAQAEVEGLRLLTLDRALAPHPLAWREEA